MVKFRRPWYTPPAIVVPAPRPVAMATPGGVRGREIGRTGDPFWDGHLVGEDRRPALRGQNRYRVYDQMRDDPTVETAMNLVKMPIVGAEWTVEPASPSPQDQQIAEFLQTDLHSMPTTFMTWMQQALLMLEYGSMLFEVVPQLRDDGMIHLSKMAFRHPSTIQYWRVTEHDDFDGVVQNLTTIEAPGEVTIPCFGTGPGMQSGVVVFVHRLEGSDYRGRSALSAAYKPWYMKSNMEEIDAISKERRAAGIDVAKIGAEFNTNNTDKLEDALMSLRTHEQQYLVVPPGVDYSIEGAARSRGQHARFDGVPRHSNSSRGHGD